MGMGEGNMRMGVGDMGKGNMRMGKGAWGWG